MKELLSAGLASKRLTLNFLLSEYFYQEDCPYSQRETHQTLIATTQIFLYADFLSMLNTFLDSSLLNANLTFDGLIPRLRSLSTFLRHSG